MVFIKSLIVPLLSPYNSFLLISVRKQLKVHINTAGNIKSILIQHLLSLSSSCLPWKVRVSFV